MIATNRSISVNVASATLSHREKKNNQRYLKLISLNGGGD